MSYIGLVCCYGYLFPKHNKANIDYKLGWWGHIYSRLEEVKTVTDIDVLFLGSSHCYRGFDNRIFEKYGLSSFNLGTSAQSPLQTEVLLNRYLKQLNPKIVIFEVTPIVLRQGALEASLDLVSNDKNDFHSLALALDVNNITLYNTLIQAYFRDLLSLNKDFMEKPQYADDSYINGGYVEKKFKHFKYIKHIKEDMVLNKRKLSAFETCLDIIAKSDAQLILVQAPITNTLYTSNNNNQEFDSLMISYGKYYNFNTKPFLDDSLHFYDTHHLNQEGVNIFNELLIDTLKLQEFN